jgi:hypothetical protein
VGQSEGVIKMTTTMAAASIQVPKIDVMTALLWLFREPLSNLAV